MLPFKGAKLQVAGFMVLAISIPVWTATRSSSYYPYNSNKGYSSTSTKTSSSYSTKRATNTKSSNGERQTTLLNLLGFNRWENMINRVLAYDQYECVPRMICEAVVDRNTSSPIFSNLAAQLPGVFGAGNAGVSPQQLLLQQQQQQQQQQQGLPLPHDPFNGLTTGGGGQNVQQSQNLPESGNEGTQQLPLTPQGFLSTFLSQIGLGTTTLAPPILSKLYTGNVGQGQPPAYLPQYNQGAYQQGAAGQGAPPSGGGPIYTNQYTQQQGDTPLATLLSSGNPNALNPAVLQQLQYQLQQQQLLNSFQNLNSRPSGTVSFRELRKRAIEEHEVEEYKKLFVEGVHNELKRSKRQIAIQVGSMEQLFNVFRKVVGEETMSYKLADAAYQGTKMDTSRECREHYKDCPTDALGWIEALAKMQLPSLSFG